MKIRGRKRWNGEYDEVDITVFDSAARPKDRGVFLWTLERGDPYASGGVVLTPAMARRVAARLMKAASQLDPTGKAE